VPARDIVTLRGAPQLSLTVFTETRQAGMWLDIALVYWLCLEATLDNYISPRKSSIEIAMAEFDTFSNI
jgi:hypothetical protein